MGSFLVARNLLGCRCPNILGCKEVLAKWLSLGAQSGCHWVLAGEVLISVQSTSHGMWSPELQSTSGPHEELCSR